MKIKPKKSLIGKKFHYLTVIEQAEDYVSPSGNRQTRWLCKCDCGKKKIVLGSSLTSGNAKSCTCQKLKMLKKQNKYEINGNEVIVYFNNCNEKMICDLEDWEKLKDYYGKFILRISYKNKGIYLGCFDTIEEAKIAREKAEMEILKKEGVV